MEEEVRDAVFGNVGTTVAFRVGPFDAEVLETIFMPKFTKEDVVTLDRRQIYLTLMIDGVGSQPFSAVTIPPIEAPPVSYRERVIASSRAQFTAERNGVENSILKELAVSAAPPAPRSPIVRESQTFTKPAVARPTAPTKSTEDLKSILRMMIAKNSVEKENRHEQQKQSLKGALAGVLANDKKKQPFEVPEDALRKVLKGET